MRSSSLVKQLVGLSLLVLCLMAGGCVRTDHPILKDEQVKANDALVGKWVSDDGKVRGEVKAGENNQYKLSYTNEEGKTGNFIVRFGKIGELNVAEVRADVFPTGTNDEGTSLVMPLYTMFVIDETPPKVTLTAIDVDWFKKYTQANPQELNVTGMGPDYSIVNASTEEFQAFFLKHFKDKDMLSEPKTFVRPGDPTTRPAPGK